MNGIHRRKGTAPSPLLASSAVLVAIALMAGCSESPPEPDPSTSTSPSATLATDVLLPAEDMPAWNGAIVWSTSEPDPATPALGVCAVPPPESLGAVDVVTEDYAADSTAPDGDEQADPDERPILGINQVSLFADATGASSALTAFNDSMTTCESGTLAVTDPTSSRISGTETGHTWTAFATDPADAELGRFEFVGFAVKGSALTMVGFSLSGQDANFEEDPLTDAMSASLARLP